METNSEVAYDGPLLEQKTSPNGPITASRKKRTLNFYLGLCLLGALPSLLGWGSSWQAFGWGLWFPGAGFIALGGWSLLAAMLTWLFFALGFVAWFGSGMIVAPVIVWFGAALVAALTAGDQLWPAAHWAVPLLTIAMALAVSVSSNLKFRKDLGLLQQRNQYFPRAFVEMRAAQEDAPDSAIRVLDEDQLGTMRWLLDRALQPVGELNGFTRIDQFQTSALRYQLNYIGYALAEAQRHYTPNFHGYLSEAQRRLIEQYLHPQIWNYWRLENAWGNLSLDADPAKKDNIMLTGYFNIQVCAYMKNTGDMRYAEPGSLTFRLNSKNSFAHSVHTINQSLLDNWRGQEYSLYPCEPNWVYPACNMHGFGAMVAYDTLFGTEFGDELKADLRHKFLTEFTTVPGGVVPLRSKLTGHALPFPAPDAANVRLLNPYFPDLAERYWTLARHENFREDGGIRIVNNTAPAVDLGNYKKGELTGLDCLYGAAKEMGDQTSAELLMSAIRKNCVEYREKGRRYFEGSTMANAGHAVSVFGFKNAWREVLTEPVPESVSMGPLLVDVDYPGVLVAHAMSSGEDLDLVLVGEAQSKPHKLLFSRLKPGVEYSLKGSDIDSTFTATVDGGAAVELSFEGRQSLQLVPV